VRRPPGYWTDLTIEAEIRPLIVGHGWAAMPSANALRAVGQNALAVAITRHGGMDAWADRLGLARSEHDSRLGWTWEDWFADQARSRGLTVTQRTRVKDPIDLSVNGHRVDVKSAMGRVISGGTQWTWRVAKDRHDCEAYALVARELDQDPVLMIVPASEIPLTCTTARRGGRLFGWVDRWDLVT
jgi:hypothetical protein